MEGALPRTTVAIDPVAVRELLEGAPATLDLLSRACGRSRRSLTRAAEKAGWSGDLDGVMDPEALDQRLAALSSRLVRAIEAAVAEAQATGIYDKGRIDGLSAMLRIAEKLGEMNRLPERAAEKQKRSDADLAAALALIDARIVELACELAASLGGGQSDGEGSALPTA
jgi:hypothetical protein